MQTLKCDILVVGAGPAGAAAARSAALKGADVLLIERRARVGEPVQCAEFIPAMLKGRVNLGNDFIAQKVAGMKTYRPGCETTVTRAPGYIIHRDRFDRALVRAAQEDGAKVMTATRAVERSESGVVMLHSGDGRKFEVAPKMIIGADGPHSTVGKWVGAVNSHLLPGAQVTLALTEPRDHTEVYFEEDIFAGYGWLFPKNKVANVGLGLKHGVQSKESLKKILDRFVDKLKSLGRVSGEPLGYAAGWIPSEPVRKTVYGSIALAGDAAGHTHAITGAGIFAAVLAGKMAGKWAGRAVNEKNPDLLNRYDEEWQDLMADTLDRAYQRRQYMETHWDDFQATVRKCWVAFRDYYA